MSKLLLHIGLPKTATSSLQRNVLMPLHEQRRINFLGWYVRPGRYVWADKVFNPFAGVFDRISARCLPSDDLQRLRRDMEGMLARDRMNVISNEDISSVQILNRSMVPENALRTASVRLHNLGELFHGDDVTILLSLRSPVDYVFSWYVESYYWRFYEWKEYATSAWFFDQLLRHGPDDELWFAFFYDAYLQALARHFDRINVMLYEDLQHDPQSYFSTIATGLQSDPEEIERLFLEVRQNPGVYTSSGKQSRRLKVRQIVRQRFPNLFRRYESVRPLLQRVPFLLPLYYRLTNFEAGVPVEHPYPDEETQQRLQEKLGLQDDYLTRVHGVSEEKLARYGYLHPAYGVDRSPAPPRWSRSAAEVDR